MPEIPFGSLIIGEPFCMLHAGSGAAGPNLTLGGFEPGSFSGYVVAALGLYVSCGGVLALCG